MAVRRLTPNRVRTKKRNKDSGISQTQAKPLVLFVGCHPDDVELGAGGTLRRFLLAGYPVKVIFLTRGGYGCDARLRERESRAACRLLGARNGDVVFGKFKDSQVPNDKRVLDFIEGLHLEGAPCQKHLSCPVFAAFIHSKHDVHQDHRVAHHWCVTAFRHVPRVFAYESPSYTDAFAPTTFVDISDVIKQKGEALACHESQLALQRPYMEYEAMQNVARFRGLRIGVQFAEAFETLKSRLDV